MTVLPHRPPSRDHTLRRIATGERVTFDEIAEAMLPNAHIDAIAARTYSDVYPESCRRDLRDLLEQLAVLSQALKQFHQEVRDKIDDPTPPASLRTLPWLRKR
jgi:hypothetical protein